MYKLLVSPNNDSFTSFFLIQMLFISLYCLTALVRISSTMFKKNGQSFLPLSKLLALVLSYMVFIMLRHALSMPNLLMVILFCFTVKKTKKQHFVKFFFCICSNDKGKTQCQSLSCVQLCNPQSLVGLQPTMLHCPWNFPGKNTGVGYHSLLQGIFPTWDQTHVSHIAGRFFTI